MDVWCRVHNTLDPDSRINRTVPVPWPPYPVRINSLCPAPMSLIPLLLMVIGPFLDVPSAPAPNHSHPNPISHLRHPCLPFSSMHLFLIPHWVHSHPTIPLHS